jgi:hypothetical protein
VAYTVVEKMKADKSDLFDSVWQSVCYSLRNTAICFMLLTQNNQTDQEAILSV